MPRKHIKSRCKTYDSKKESNNNTGVAQWLRHCTASQKVLRSIPSRVTGDFFRNIRVPRVDSASKNGYQDIPGGKGGQCVGVTTLPPSCAKCHEIWKP